IRKPLKIAVMGCTVNGIGESKGADFGVCGGKDKSVIIKDGEIYKTVSNDSIFSEITALVEKYDVK
ncbi:MAG: flavodoxin-dependent (E)-4-hydroxy-3-methylbut-2-enyl-diphosphate synthase, partial [Clostridia bacterium]|nr:flavodoxin-dependent (E)-4-hydroxy-3-methylbut-2-enyl-diphosphate synthase [Clostridia bacterium]